MKNIVHQVGQRLTALFRRANIIMFNIPTFSKAFDVGVN